MWKNVEQWYDVDVVDMFDFNQFRKLLGASSGKAYKSPSVFFVYLWFVHAGLNFKTEVS